MMKVLVQSGEITKVEAAALIAAICPSGWWIGGVDNLIQLVAGTHFHDQVRRVMPLSFGQTVIAVGDSLGLAFRNVVFVVHDQRQPLRNVIKAGLRAASEAGFNSVTWPVFRTDVLTHALRGQAEKPVFRPDLLTLPLLREVEAAEQEQVLESAYGVREYIDENPATRVEVATFVVCENPQAVARVR
jgi:O-acetyl-ADP-ribose deacetylase (regulator of RNase III)